MRRPRCAHALTSAMLFAALGVGGAACASSAGGAAAGSTPESTNAPSDGSSSSAAPSSSAPNSGAPSSNAPGSAAPSSSAPSSNAPSSSAIPTTEQLREALLTASDLGGSFTVITPGSAGGTVNAGSSTGPSGDSGPSGDTSTTDSTTTSGCPALDDLLNGSGGSPAAGGVTGQEVEFSAGSTGPYLDEELVAGPAAEVNTEFGQVRDALASCKSWTVSNGTVSLTFNFSPITFTPGADTTAVRLDGTYQGVEVNGYIVYEEFPSVLLGYAYLQLGGGSSQVAYADFTQAVAKVERVLGIGS